MKLPTMHGLIERRILINYRVAPHLLAPLLPPPFQPQCVNGWGVVGICLIRLRHLRPKPIPMSLGISSENAAYRMAVQWQQNGRLHHGVYIPRRETSLRLNTLVGGRLFPGQHHYAYFKVKEQNGRFDIALRSEDERTALAIQAKIADTFPQSSCFTSLTAASNFFEKDALGYSATPKQGKYEGLRLKTYNWKVEPLTVSYVHSNFFEDESVFPKGAITFDNALLMRGIAHEWQTQQPLWLFPKLNQANLK